MDGGEGYFHTNYMANEPVKFKKLFNPTNEDLHFTWDSAPYAVKAGETETFIDYIAEQGARILADKNVKTANPDEHQVLMTAYLENSDPYVIAKQLHVNLDAIRAEALTKEKEKARVINLESQVADLNKKLEAVLMAQAKQTQKVEEEKIDKRSKEYRDSLKASQAQEAKEAE